jgi:hypothetical protein
MLQVSENYFNVGTSGYMFHGPLIYKNLTVNAVRDRKKKSIKCRSWY